jgi:hypothetical protein
MIIAIDYDNTFTLDPDLFRDMAQRFQRRGHRVIVITGRSDEDPWGTEVRTMVRDLCPIVFAGLSWKREAAIAEGYIVDVWIDDMPEYIGPQDPELAQHKGAPYRPRG